MATNTDFLKVMIADTTFHWPRLDQPYRYNNAEKRTEACAPTVTGAGYSIAFDMPMDKARELFTALKAHYNATRARNAKLPEFSQVFGMKKDEAAGTVRFTAKKRAVSNSGELNKPPVVIDAQKQPLAEKNIWSGSTGNLRVLAFAATDPDGKGGISLLLDTVQVVNAVYGGDGLDDFEQVSTTKALTAEDDFNTPAAPPPVVAPMPASIFGLTAIPADAEF
jgi:hypothetical protein